MKKFGVAIYDTRYTRAGIIRSVDGERRGHIFYKQNQHRHAYDDDDFVVEEDNAWLNSNTQVVFFDEEMMASEFINRFLTAHPHVCCIPFKTDTIHRIQPGNVVASKFDERGMLP